MINPFETAEGAKRYHLYRPRYHHLPFGIIRSHVGADFANALDVACGTGHSTFALSQISAKTIGCDLSEGMLSEARCNFALEFIKAEAGQLPFPDRTFDIVNISMAFHWVAQEEFLREARRVLKVGGFLAIDNYGFRGNISPDPETQKSHHDFFAQYLPSAGRGPGYPNEELIGLLGMEVVKEINYEHIVDLNAHEFMNLLMTWSNFQILSAGRQHETLRRMKEIYEPIFAQQSLPLDFGGKSILYRFCGRENA